VWLGISIGAIFIAAALWGKQYGAGLIAAINAPWILPISVVALIGSAIAKVLNCLFTKR
jgi:hypothetical protein